MIGIYSCNLFAYKILEELKNMENIKILREKTGAGMVDCKKALDEASGDIELAAEILRKKGIAKAAKRGERDATEGIVKIAVNEAGTEGYIMEVNSETDFVARNEKFQKFTDDLLALIIAKKPENLEALFGLEFAESNVSDALGHLSGTIGEKISVSRFAIINGATVSSYSHMGGRIGVLVALDKADKKDLAYDLAMQAVASNPRYLDPSEVPEEELNKEKEIYREQLKNEGKPAEIIEKILAGKVNKYYEDVCLLNQEYIKDDKKKVKDILGDVKIEKFVRFSL